jgi:RHS repeat-associated protein
VTSASGAIETQYTYEPFGKTTATGQASTNSYQYTGRENDGMGLSYYRARYYDPKLQRFISEDPIGFAGGVPLQYLT